jgi:NAD(P)-dependent dehydrogenase (short-subunit alcohol dehydrogenase family)
MKTFEGKLAVITGGGTGMGRELAVQLATEGCALALCDVSAFNMAETQQRCETAAPTGTRVTTFVCDVSQEAQVTAFRDALLEEHQTDHINLLFNNAGIGGGGSFVAGERDEWERTFNVCWTGVYLCSRAFLPLLIASKEACIINTSSVNGFWASLGPMIPHTAYSAAKFAVKGFTEALITDLRINAPHVKVALVMPGHVGTEIVTNTFRILGGGDAATLPKERLDEMRAQFNRMGFEAAGLTDEALRQILQMQAIAFRESAPLSAAGAAKVILDGVRAGRWRILVGEDAKALDQAVRADADGGYDSEFLTQLHAKGHFRGALGLPAN